MTPNFPDISAALQSAQEQIKAIKIRLQNIRRLLETRENEKLNQIVVDYHKNENQQLSIEEFSNYLAVLLADYLQSLEQNDSNINTTIQDKYPLIFNYGVEINTEIDDLLTSIDKEAQGQIQNSGAKTAIILDFNKYKK